MITVQAPIRLRFEDEEKTLLAMDWRDGHVSVYPTAYLRGWCPCAPCQGHSAGTAFVGGGDPRIVGMEPVGAYALSIRYADGHATGVYPWEKLRAWCPCRACGGPLEGTPPPIADLVPEA